MDTNQLKKNQYLDKINHAPYGAMVVTGLIILGLITVMVLVAIF